MGKDYLKWKKEERFSLLSMKDGGFCKLSSCDPYFAHERDHSQGKVWLALLMGSPQDGSYFCLHGTHKSVSLSTYSSSALHTHPVLSPSPPALSLSQHQGLFK